MKSMLGVLMNTFFYNAQHTQIAYSLLIAVAIADPLRRASFMMLLRAANECVKWISVPGGDK